MARFFGPLVLLCLAASGFAQTPSPGMSVTTVNTNARPASPGASTTAPTPSTTARLEELRKSFEQLSPEQQQRFLQNFHHWQELSSDEREVMRQRQRVHQKKREEEMQEAYQKSGLHLNEERQLQFKKRYEQERQKLEEQILKESQERRQAGNVSIVDQLKKEFSATPPSSVH